MLKLVGSETYDLVYKIAGEKEDECPVFKLKKLSSGNMNDIDDQLTTMSREAGGNITLLVGTQRKLKIKYALVSWVNVADSKGKVSGCTDEAKELLPIEVQDFLEKNIDDVNAIKGVGIKETKNS